jgi:MFS family permease
VIEFFVRRHGWTRTEIGLTYGTISMVTGIAGSVWAGYYAGRLLRRGVADAAMRLTLGCTLVLGPLAIVMPLVESGGLALAFCVPMTWCMAMPPGLSTTALQAITPNRMRGQVIAFYMICVSFLSYLLAPLIVGLMNDYVFGREDAIHLSLATLAVINYSVAAVCLLLALAPLRRALAAAQLWEAAPGETS